ncbi:hypothetical protein EI94DRAFT_1729150 [Lactarius quietus]|nr:hypothetical protein EI94DRAFT_1729150 [Lactarius quietus]
MRRAALSISGMSPRLLAMVQRKLWAQLTQETTQETIHVSSRRGFKTELRPCRISGRQRVRRTPFHQSWV